MVSEKSSWYFVSSCESEEDDEWEFVEEEQEAQFSSPTISQRSEPRKEREVTVTSYVPSEDLASTEKVEEKARGEEAGSSEEEWVYDSEEETEGQSTGDFGGALAAATITEAPPESSVKVAAAPTPSLPFASPMIDLGSLPAATEGLMTVEMVEEGISKAVGATYHQEQPQVEPAGASSAPVTATPSPPPVSVPPPASPCSTPPPHAAACTPSARRGSDRGGRGGGRGRGQSPAVPPRKPRPRGAARGLAKAALGHMAGSAGGASRSRSTAELQSLFQPSASPPPGLVPSDRDDMHTPPPLPKRRWELEGGAVNLDTDSGPELSLQCAAVAADAEASAAEVVTEPISIKTATQKELRAMCDAVASSMSEAVSSREVEAVPLDADSMKTQSLTSLSPGIIDQLAALQLIQDNGKSLTGGQEPDSKEAAVVAAGVSASPPTTRARKEKKATVKKRQWFTKYQASRADMSPVMTRVADGGKSGHKREASLPYFQPPASGGDPRGNVVAEIMHTEESYAKDLETLITFFMDPLRRPIKKRGKAKQESGTATLIGAEEHDQLFSNIEAIHSLHRVIVSEFKKQSEKAEGEQKIGECFILLSKCLVLYIEYCSNYPCAINVLAALQETNKEFASFLRYAKSQPPVRGLPLESFLIMPVQRMCKYPLFLRELIKYTDESHADFPAISQAVIEMDASCQKINERKRNVDNMRHFLTIKARTGVSFMGGGRRFIDDGVIGRYRKGKVKTGRYVLFSDMLVFICDGKVAVKVPLASLMLQDAEVPGQEFAVKFTSKKTKCILCPPHLAAKEKLVGHIHERMGEYLTKNLDSINKHLRLKADNKRKKLSVDKSNDKFSLLCIYGQQETVVNLLPELCVRSFVASSAAKAFGLPAADVRISYRTAENKMVEIGTDDDFNRMVPFLKTLFISV